MKAAALSKAERKEPSGLEEIKIEAAKKREKRNLILPQFSIGAGKHLHSGLLALFSAHVITSRF